MIGQFVKPPHDFKAHSDSIPVEWPPLCPDTSPLTITYSYSDRASVTTPKTPRNWSFGTILSTNRTYFSSTRGLPLEKRCLAQLISCNILVVHLTPWLLYLNFKKSTTKLQQSARLSKVTGPYQTIGREKLRSHIGRPGTSSEPLQKPPRLPTKRPGRLSMAKAQQSLKYQLQRQTLRRPKQSGNEQQLSRPC